MKNHIPSALTLAVSLVLAQAASAQLAGPSSSQTSYLLPSGPMSGNVTATAILTVGDDGDPGAGTYKMVGIPDGLGAIDNNPGTPGVGTFTVYMNHELTAGAGAVRAHGSVGSFVSTFTVDKATLAVTGGSDLIQQVSTWNTGLGSYNAPAAGIPIGRLCSGDLAPVSAYFNSGSGLGTTSRIFQSGEEIGAEGRQFAHMITGPQAGISYELPRLGKFSWENGVANWGSGDKTVVIGTDDSTPGQVYVYVGDKTNTGSDIAKAGLTNGSLYGVKTTIATEDRVNGLDGAAGADINVSFSLQNFGDVSSLSGATLNTNSNAAGVTNFLRPEDVAWDLNDATVAYFATTDRFSQVKAGTGAQTGFSRLWKMDFSDATFLTGGTLTMLLDGSEAGQMYDNLTVTLDGKIVLQEDPGGGATPGTYLAKVWEYDIATDGLTEILQHDGSRFASNNPLFGNTNDEEASGVIDVTSFFTAAPLPGEHYYLMDVQAHYTTGYQVDATTVEGGQLNLVHVVPEPSTALSLMGGLGMLLGLRRRRA